MAASYTPVSDAPNARRLGQASMGISITGLVLGIIVGIILVFYFVDFGDSYLLYNWSATSEQYYWSNALLRADAINRPLHDTLCKHYCHSRTYVNHVIAWVIWMSDIFIRNLSAYKTVMNLNWATLLAHRYVMFYVCVLSCSTRHDFCLLYTSDAADE